MSLSKRSTPSKQFKVSVDFDNPVLTLDRLSNGLDKLLRNQGDIYPILRVKFLAAGYVLPDVGIVEDVDTESESDQVVDHQAAQPVMNSVDDADSLRQQKEACAAEIVELVSKLDRLAAPELIREQCNALARKIVEGERRQQLKHQSEELKAMKAEIANLNRQRRQQQSNLREAEYEAEESMVTERIEKIEKANLIKEHLDELQRRVEEAKLATRQEYLPRIEESQKRIQELETELEESIRKQDELKAQMNKSQRIPLTVSQAAKQRAKQLVEERREQAQFQLETKKRKLVSLEEEQRNRWLRQNNVAIDFICRELERSFVGGAQTDAQERKKWTDHMNHLKEQCEALSGEQENAQALQQAIQDAGSDLNLSINNLTMDMAATHQVRRYIPQAALFYNLKRYVLQGDQTQFDLKDLFPTISVFRDDTQMRYWKQLCELGRLAYEYPQVLCWNLPLEAFYEYFDGLVRIIDAVRNSADVAEFRRALGLCNKKAAKGEFGKMKVLWG